MSMLILFLISLPPAVPPSFPQTVAEDTPMSTFRLLFPAILLHGTFDFSLMAAGVSEEGGREGGREGGGRKEGRKERNFGGYERWREKERGRGREGEGGKSTTERCRSSFLP